MTTTETRTRTSMIGVLHYVWPQPPKTARSIACIGVVCGFNNRMRCFSVFERMEAAQ